MRPHKILPKTAVFLLLSTATSFGSDGYFSLGEHEEVTPERGIYMDCIAGYILTSRSNGMGDKTAEASLEYCRPELELYTKSISHIFEKRLWNFYTDNAQQIARHWAHTLVRDREDALRPVH